MVNNFIPMCQQTPHQGKRQMSDNIRNDAKLAPTETRINLRGAPGSSKLTFQLSSGSSTDHPTPSPSLKSGKSSPQRKTQRVKGVKTMSQIVGTGPPATKRRRGALPEELGTARRQPRTSCDFCRLKKLKCDRLQPCSCCATRGIECRGQLTPPGLMTSASAPESGNDLALRVQRLEEAVFGSADVVPATSRTNKALYDAGSSQTAVRPAITNQTVPVGGSHIPQEILNQDHSGNFVFLIGPPGGFEDGPDLSKVVWLPSQGDALALLDQYVENSLTLDRIIRETAARALFQEVYAHLARAQEETNDRVAFALAICADSAFHWNQGARRLTLFNSAGEAARRSLIWRKAVWELLDHSQRAGLSSLEGIQARMILQDTLYTVEGGSARWRYLLSSSLAVARELSLHRIDSPHYENKDDSATREMKRRVWWHLVGTDWLSSCGSGPLDRTYTTNPQHMAVHYPSNINDEDLPLCDQRPARPLDVVTDMSWCLARIRLAEVCREVADLLTLTTEIDHLRFEQVLRIDRLTEEVRDLFPPPCILHIPLPPEAPSQIRRQRQVINLALEARRARLFRPFLQSNITTRDPRLLRFRTACLRSARAVMDIASEYLAGFVDDETHPTVAAPKVSRVPLPRDSAIVIHHLFQACVVMATDPSLGGNNSSRLPEAEARREALAKSSRLLGRVSEQSPMAADLVGKLVNVLKRYYVQGVDAGGISDGGRLSGSTLIAPTGIPEWPSIRHLTIADQNPGIIALTSASAASLPGADMSTIPWAGVDFGGFGGLWESLIGHPSTNDDWGQVFTDLDHLGGPL